ncbi:transmembrane protein 241 isoform X2 [Oenanthe melanoleuca]|uniref:transmembrane protein 241 isoform X2 n=1 Tax=Oenanthe melanoleuca TaxID=2939378 RepID=UPI0024C1C34B|nr:transmembrane protein 241 isoform X2 [Oenanthe melanoleuca]
MIFASSSGLALVFAVPSASEPDAGLGGRAEGQCARCPAGQGAPGGSRRQSRGGSALAALPDRALQAGLWRQRSGGSALAALPGPHGRRAAAAAAQRRCRGADVSRRADGRRPPRRAPRTHMYLKRPAGGLAFCLFYLASSFTNKYVLSVLQFTYPTLFQGWQTLVGGLLLHISWKLGWVEINLCSRSEILSWLPASVLFVGIIYAGSRALSRLPIPVFLTVHNAAEVITCGFQKFVQKETSLLKVCSVLFLLAAAVCLPLCDTQFDPNGYLWALIHLICLGAYKVFHKLWKPGSLSDLDQQYINYVFSVVLLASASHPAGDLFSALDFPFLYFYRFHSSCCASGLLGFFLMLHTVKLKSSTTSGQYAAWSFLAKVITASLSPFFFVMTANVLTISCLVIGGIGEALLVYTERTGT